jgi:hypothetical protein
MAEKRMFTMKIINSDSFKEMPLSSQALYFHLGMNADDEGFLNNAKSVQRSISASDDDMKLLVAKNFIIPFESGVVVIKHWKMHNQIQPSKLKPTQYTEERSLLAVKENKAYTLNLNNVNALPTDCRRIADDLPTDCRRIADKKPTSIEEISVEEISIGECRESSNQTEQPPQTSTESIPMTDNEYNALVRKYGKSFVDSKIERAKQYTNTYNYTTISKWCEEDFKKQHTPDANRFNNYQQRPKQSDDYYNNLLDNNVSRE